MHPDKTRGSRVSCHHHRDGHAERLEDAIVVESRERPKQGEHVFLVMIEEGAQPFAIFHVLVGDTPDVWTIAHDVLYYRSILDAATDWRTLEDYDRSNR